ncbi:hypothetical protein D2E49_12305 [Mycobacteroides abscessus]|nr:hypothetical protein DDT53_10355 [Mycobacteroides abscessus]QCO26746.1 hypothetical protein CFE69_13205 [Mycobacteroides abscessus subsp. massiliense]AWG59418.1 hypothetical protein DDT47_10535 [Mycobacteroides abscessus]PVA62435.1 hypothetical protein DDJ87_19000 [Mycobacteroides abscessus]PVB06633.1 hypothetical protein DDJ51_06515 [Mycobacteroides abscessus]
MPHARGRSICEDSPPAVTNDTPTAAPGCRSRFHVPAPVCAGAMLRGRGQGTSHPRELAMANTLWVR